MYCDWPPSRCGGTTMRRAIMFAGARAELRAHDVQRRVDAGRGARAGDDLGVLHEEHVGVDRRPAGYSLGQLLGVHPVGRAAPPVEDAGLRRARTRPEQTLRAPRHRGSAASRMHLEVRARRPGRRSVRRHARSGRRRAATDRSCVHEMSKPSFVGTGPGSAVAIVEVERRTAGIRCGRCRTPRRSRRTRTARCPGRASRTTCLQHRNCLGRVGRNQSVRCQFCHFRQDRRQAIELLAMTRSLHRMRASLGLAAGIAATVLARSTATRYRRVAHPAAALTRRSARGAAGGAANAGAHDLAGDRRRRLHRRRTWCARYWTQGSTPSCSTTSPRARGVHPQRRRFVHGTILDGELVLDALRASTR